MKKHIFLLILILHALLVSSQVSYHTDFYSAKKIMTVSPLEEVEDFAPKVFHDELPIPGSGRYYLNEVKKEVSKRFPRKSSVRKFYSENDAPSLTQGLNFPAKKVTFLPNGDTITTIISGGIPNDNTMAIGNDGKVILSFNSSILAYDPIKDTAVFSNKSLHSFTPDFTLNDKYDPKLLYDPQADRYVLCFLNGRESFESQVIFGFSTTSNPADPWNFYALPGNPLSNECWTDYPAIALTEDELFLTVNLINDVAATWQTGFNQSIIWQMDKDSGYAGASELPARLWSDINFGSKRIRNLNPVQGGSDLVGPNLYLLSNRNFDLENDSIFFLEVTGLKDVDSTELKISVLKSDKPYGMPPDGIQNHTDHLATNDSRVLGAFIENGVIQFAGNTIIHSTGFAGVYHGIISDLNAEPKIQMNFITDDTLDFGYPNIAYVGTHDCSRQAVLSFNHSSLYDFPGHSSILYQSDGTYSERLNLKSGESIVDRLSGAGYERRGDYSGIQRKYNEVGKVWAAGFFGRNNSNSTWVSEIIAPADIEKPIVELTAIEPSSYGKDNGALTAIASKGAQPYEYLWSNNETYPSLSGVTIGEYSLTITDAIDCLAYDSISVGQPLPNNAVFPNPSADFTQVYFELAKDEVVMISIYSSDGKRVIDLYRDKVKAGKNIFEFNAAPLTEGTYIVTITGENKEVYLSEKFIKK